MSCVIAEIAAEAEEKTSLRDFDSWPHDRESNSPQRTQGNKAEDQNGEELQIEDLPAHEFPARAEQVSFENVDGATVGAQRLSDILREYQEIQSEEENRRRRIYRGRTVAMLRRYLQYSIETGRLPSVLGQEFFRAKVTSYSVVTFEDRVIFVHDMEKCLNRLDEFSRELIARHILQEHDQAATAKLLHCTERTVRRLAPIALDLFCEILIDMGLLERMDSIPAKSCQGGLESDFPVSNCDERKNKF